MKRQRDGRLLESTLERLDRELEEVEAVERHRDLAALELFEKGEACPISW